MVSSLMTASLAALEDRPSSFDCLVVPAHGAMDLKVSYTSDDGASFRMMLECRKCFSRRFIKAVAPEKR
jgi:hypothetical protein